MEEFTEVVRIFYMGFNETPTNKGNHMNKLQITKSVVSKMTGYSVGVATAVFFSTFRKHSENKVIEIATDASTLVTVYVVGSLAHEPIRKYTDAQIDAAYAWYLKTFKPNLNK